MINNDLALSDLIDRVEAKHKDCCMCEGTGKCFEDSDQIGEPEIEIPCPDCGDERYLLNAILIMEAEIEKQRLNTFDRFVMAAISGSGFSSGAMNGDIIAHARGIATEAMRLRDEADDPPVLDRTVPHP